MRIPLTENSDRVLGSPQVARWSYSEAKAIDELYSFQLNKNDSFPVTIGRLFNTVGTRQSGQYGMVLPRFINAALKNLPLVVYGNGSQTRSFCSVSDVVIAIAGLISTSKTIGQVYNIGSNAELSIYNLAELVILLTNSKSEIVFKDLNKVFGENFEEPLRRVPDTSKINKEIGWVPQKMINDIINEIVEFEKHHEI
jgi:UDP-glucose 4-epimerase